jgi:hypothetical protein
MPTDLNTLINDEEVTFALHCCSELIAGNKGSSSTDGMNEHELILVKEEEVIYSLYQELF